MDITIITNLELHDSEYKFYIIQDGNIIDDIVVDKDDFSKFILHYYKDYNANKIILFGNDILTYYYEKKIREKSTDYAITDITIERRI